MLFDWMRLTSWLRQRGMSEPEVTAEVARNLHGNPYFVDAATVGPEQRNRAINKPARTFDTFETCERCGHIFDQATTSDIELVTGLCQTCWGRRRNTAHNRGEQQ